VAPPTPGEAAVLERLGLPRAQRLWRAVGCAACRDSGYRGRTGIYELVLVDDGFRRLVHDRADELALREVCARAGTRPLIADGARWLDDGTTSLAELLRVAGAAG
jgi:general secretion pathway protein E